ncbi:MAG: SMC-Scp complex subunit ScpB [Bdellovibrionales bacterium]|nr:SMC-Scp complex subunit ScpB [Bdellovibrionales bacterium]
MDIEKEEFNEEELLEAHEKSEALNQDDEQDELENVEDVIDDIEFEATQESFVEGTELESFESAEVEELEFLELERVISIVESLLFATDRPQSIATFKQAFKGTQVKSKDIKKALESLMVEYAGGTRGITLEEVSGGYQLRTKIDNIEFLKRMVKGRSFKLSGPALEVLAIAAYKQPCVKSQIDEIRGVESGHLLRGLMERGLVRFAGKSELPGKPMLYETTKKFLEIFGLRNLKELPSLSEIDDLIPEGIGEIEEEKETLDQITGQMAKDAGTTYSEGEEELEKISDQLEGISTSSEFFEQEKAREKAKKEAEKAQMIQEAIILGEEVSARDKNWLERYEAKKAEEEQEASDASEVAEALTDINEETELKTASESVTSETESEEVEVDIENFESTFSENETDTDVKMLAESNLADVDFEKLKTDMEIFNEEDRE